MITLIIVAIVALGAGFYLGRRYGLKVGAKIVAEKLALLQVASDVKKVF